jgi:hypothetical protein
VQVDVAEKQRNHRALAGSTESQIEIRWATTAVDVDGHLDSSGIAGYNVFRYESENASLSSGTQIGGTVPQPPPSTNYTEALDTSTNLRPQYGKRRGGTASRQSTVAETSVPFLRQSAAT